MAAPSPSNSLTTSPSSLYTVSPTDYNDIQSLLQNSALKMDIAGWRVKSGIDH